MKINGLSHQKAKNLEAGKYNDGQGLWLHKRTRHKGKWVARLFVGGKRREMGLGSWPDVSIGEARERAANARKTVRDGIDPISARKAENRYTKRLTIAEAIEACFEARRADLKGDGIPGQWLSPLSNHVVPKLGAMALEDLTQHNLKTNFDPIWHEKPEVARKALTRMNLVLKHGAAIGLNVDIQAVEKAKALLGKQRHKVRHIPALPYNEAPSFYSMLSSRDLMSCYALRFLMLTATRTSEVRFATHSEIDGNVWTIPAERTKTNKEHRVPLTEEALAVVKSVRNESDHLFIGLRGNPLSDASMSTFMKREGFTARPHGFRATFRTWVEEQTDTPFEVKESALGHKVDAGVVGVYQRSDRLEKRSELLMEWSKYLTSYFPSTAQICRSLGPATPQCSFTEPEIRCERIIWQRPNSQSADKVTVYF